jgi:hypothetical protein
MCYLGVLPRRASLSRDLLQNAYDHNSDGWGVMYAHAGRVITHKKKAGMTEFFALWDTLPDRGNIAVHFRFGTSGPTNDEGCHPFKVLSKDDGDPIDLYMMHNGVLRGKYSGTKTKSDTMQYVEDLQRQLRLAPALLRDRGWIYMQEELLGNPNKVVFLEGNGRWTYLNHEQGTRDKDTGVWHSNKYSLEPVYSGHGKGKAANSTKWHWNHDDWDSTPYANSPTYSSNAGETARMDAAYKATISHKRAWGLQVFKGEKGQEDTHVFWKPTLAGYQRMARNNSTGALYRWFKTLEEPVGSDLCVVLPIANVIRFYPKNEQAFERGDKHSWKMEDGEHIVYPVATTSFATGGVVETTPVALLEHSQALLCPETNEACRAQCTSHCTGADGDTSDCFCLGQVKHLSGQDPRCKYFPFPQNAACDAASHAPSIVRQMASIDAELDEEEEGNIFGEEEIDREAEYVAQLFSPENLRTMSEEDMQDAIDAYPEDAAIALGAAYNCRWAFETEEDAA